MMAEIRQKMRGTTAQLDAHIGLPGHLTCDLTRGDLRVFDGVSAGGHRIPNYTFIDSTYLRTANLVSQLVTVDGTGSGIDADLLDGQHLSAILLKSDNLSGLANLTTARTNLGLGSLAVLNAGTGGTNLRNNTENDARFAQRANNLSDLTSAATARTNLGGTTVGVGVFTAANTGDAQTALDVPPTGRAVNTSTGLTGGGNLSADRTLALTGAALALHNFATNGLMTRTGASTYAGRTIAGGTGIALTNGDGVAGNPSVALAGQALAIHNLASSAFVVRSAANTFVARTLIGGTGIAVTNGTGISANPAIALEGQALALHNFNSTGVLVRTGASTFAAREVIGGTGITLTNGTGVAGNLTVAITSGGVGNSQLANNAVTEAKIANGAVTSAKLETNSTIRDWVLSRIAEASAGVVGTYALLGSTSSSAASVGFGNTKAGSELTPMGIGARNNWTNSYPEASPTESNNLISQYSGVSSTRSGTWMCCGSLRNRTDPVFFGATLWLRIA